MNSLYRMVIGNSEYLFDPVTGVVTLRIADRELYDAWLATHHGLRVDRRQVLGTQEFLFDAETGICTAVVYRCPVQDEEDEVIDPACAECRGECCEDEVDYCDCSGCSDDED